MLIYMRGNAVRLTTFTDYGLRMLMRMASVPDRAFSTAELAEEFQLSRNHLTKIMQKLSVGDVVETRRGAKGGAVLRKAPADIRLGDVVRMLEQDQAIVECFRLDGGMCTVDGRCGLKERLRRAEQKFIDDLNRSTLADIALPARRAA